ncbi:MAG: ribulokinase, partial [Acidimicrobiales bacterium]
MDFGTESGRVLVLDLSTGEEVASSLVTYPHGVIDRQHPVTGEELPSDWALQDPADYLTVIRHGVPAALREAAIPAGAVIGLGIDFTSCTVLPVARDGKPLCQIDDWRRHPHAWPKLWKHHTAQPVADRLTQVARERAEPFLSRYGGRLSSEWYFPKLIEIWQEDRPVYDACSSFLEATDWVVWQLTGTEHRSSCPAGYKACWSPEDGIPSVAFFEAAYPGFSRPGEKLGSQFFALGSRAGRLRPDLADEIGLSPRVAVAVGNVDSFVSVPGAGVDSSGTYVMVVGTSICSMVVDPAEHRPPGITGVVRDGILPGRYGYEAGQAAVGDMFAWFADQLGGPLTGGPAAPAAGRAYGDLEGAAGRLRPGEAGVVALDWWNGNRSILGDADLSGVMVGMTLGTGAEHLYRAALEAVAFGNRRILDNLAEHGLALSGIVACGGIAEKSPLLMQLLADVGGLEVRVPASRQVPARGAA